MVLSIGNWGEISPYLLTGFWGPPCTTTIRPWRLRESIWSRVMEFWGLPRTWDPLTHRIHETGVFTYIWLMFMVNVGIYTKHGSFFGYGKRDPYYSNTIPMSLGIRTWEWDEGIVWGHKGSHVPWGSLKILPIWILLPASGWDPYVLVWRNYPPWN